MTEINLLPWREQRREQERKWFTTMLLAGVVVAISVAFLINSYANHLVNVQTERNKILSDEIANLDEQIKEIKTLKQVRSALISRMSIVQNLQSTRTMMVHLFDELINIIPAGIYVTKLERKNDLVTLWGFSESNANISLLMTNIENNVWIEHPELSEIKKIDEKKQPANNEFTLSFKLEPKKEGKSAQ